MTDAKERKIRYAVIGLGNIAQVAVLPAFAHAKENSELVALISSDPEKLDALASEYDIRHTGSYDDIERILSESAAEAAYVALPNSQHRPMTERLVRLGIHVLCEKPMAPTVDDCEAMIAAAASAGVKLMIAYRLHFEEANLTAIERIDRGDIGEPRIFSSVFTQEVREGDIRTQSALGGGALGDMGIYCINAARYLFRGEPLEVMAAQVRGHDARFQGADETTSAILTFSGGRVAQLVASQAAADVAEYRMVGTRGDIRLDPAYEYSTALKAFVTVDQATSEKTYAKRDQFAPELVHFSNAILEGTEPEPSGEEGLCDVRILEAIATSARTGQRVRLPPFLRSDRPTLQLESKKPAVGRVSTVHRCRSPNRNS